MKTEKAPRRAETKAPSTERVVYVCGECGQDNKTREKADACCICPKCKMRIIDKPDQGWRRHEQCSHCVVKEHIRGRRVSIRRAKETLADAEKSLAELLAEKALLDGAEKLTVE